MDKAPAGCTGGHGFDSRRGLRFFFLPHASVMLINSSLSFTGPFTIILGTPAQIGDIIQYADFSQKVSPVQIMDDTTLDEEPDVDDLYGLLDGNVTLNTSDVHVLPASKFHKYYSCK